MTDRLGEIISLRNRVAPATEALKTTRPGLKENVRFLKLTVQLLENRLVKHVNADFTPW